MPKESKPEPDFAREDFHKLLKKAAIPPVPKPVPKEKRTSDR